MGSDVRFHQSVTFLPTRQIMPLALVSEELGYGGIYVSDHVFNPRDRESRYTYSTREDGTSGLGGRDGLARPDVRHLGLGDVDRSSRLHDGRLHRPGPRPHDRGQDVGTAAVLSDDRVRLGVGVGWCKEEFDQTGQDFDTRGKRLDEMIAALRALWRGGWVEFHGRLLRRARVPDGARPDRPGTHHRRRTLPRRPPAHRRPVRRLDRGRRLQRRGGLGASRRSRATHCEQAGREDDGTSPSTSRSTNGPTSICTGASPMPASPTSCARRGWSCDVDSGHPGGASAAGPARRRRWFADEIVPRSEPRERPSMKSMP